MNRDEEKKKWMRSIAFGLAGSVLVCGVSQALRHKEAEDLRVQGQPEHMQKNNTLVLDDEEEERNSAKAKKEKQTKQKKSQRENVFSAVGLFLLSLLVKTVSMLLTGAFSKLAGTPIGSMGGFFCDCLTNFFVVAALLGCLFKRLYPERRLRELFTLRNLCWMGGSAVVFSLMRLVMTFVGGRWALLGMVVEGALILAAFALVCRKTFKVPKGASAIKSMLFSCRSKKKLFGGCVVFFVACTLLRYLGSASAVLTGYGEFLALFVLGTFTVRIIYEKVKPRKKTFCAEGYYVEMTEPEDQPSLSSPVH